MYISIRNKGEVMKSKLTKNENIQLTINQDEASILLNVLSRVGGNPETKGRTVISSIMRRFISLGIKNAYSWQDEPFVNDDVFNNKLSNLIFKDGF